jgi:hypothetical protein
VANFGLSLFMCMFFVLLLVYESKTYDYIFSSASDMHERLGDFSPLFLVLCFPYKNIKRRVHTNGVYDYIFSCAPASCVTFLTTRSTTTHIDPSTMQCTSRPSPLLVQRARPTRILLLFLKRTRVIVQMTVNFAPIYLHSQIQIQRIHIHFLYRTK